MADTISFKHSGDIGDIIASLSTVKEICERSGKKAKMYLDATGGWMDPYVKLQAPNGLKFNESAALFLKPYLEIQPYIDSVEIDTTYGNKKMDYNLNAFRRAFVDTAAIKETNQNLLYLHQYALGVPCGYKGPWLVDPTKEAHRQDGVLIARTTRYQSAHVMIEAILRNIRNAGLTPDFIGTDVEHAAFEEAFRTKTNRIKISNALEMAAQVANHGEILCNGTALYWIAVGLGHPSITHEVGCDIPTTMWRDDMPNIMYIQGAKMMRGDHKRELGMKQ